MENTPQETPYDNPELIAASHGDRQLLDRLVGMTVAAQRIEDSSGEELERAQRDYNVMYEEVQRRRTEIGLPPEDTPGTPE